MLAHDPQQLKPQGLSSVEWLLPQAQSHLDALVS